MPLRDTHHVFLPRQRSGGFLSGLQDLVQPRVGSSTACHDALKRGMRRYDVWEDRASELCAIGVAGTREWRHSRLIKEEALHAQSSTVSR